MSSRTLDDRGIRDVLERIDRHLQEPVSLCLIGGGATILLGQPNRGTEDLDAWARASRFREKALRDAVEAAGLAYNPRGEIVGAPYVQIVHPGIAQAPGYEPATGTWMGEAETVVWRGAFLTVSVPPPAVLVASKLVRCSPRDVEDCVWLMTAHALDAEAVSRAVRALPAAARGVAEDNLAMLRYLSGDGGAPKPGG